MNAASFKCCPIFCAFILISFDHLFFAIFQHLGSELLYTNTLRSINPNSTISRVATLVLPLACRIAAQQAKGPAFKISIPEEVKTFGAVSFWLEFHPPGKGPMADKTLLPRLRGPPPARAAREIRSTDLMDTLDLHVFSNCSLDRAELMVGRCVESETEDFRNSRPLLNQGLVTTSTSFLLLIVNDSHLNKCSKEGR